MGFRLWRAMGASLLLLPLVLTVATIPSAAQRTAADVPRLSR